MVKISKDFNRLIVSVCMVAALILVASLGYYFGQSAGKSFEQNQHKHSDQDYIALQACYDAVSNQVAQVNQITGHMGYSDNYSDAESAINQVNTIVNAKIVSVPNHISGGYYNCP